MSAGAPELAALLLALAVVGAGMGLCGIRIVRGPSPFDRVLAFDCFTLNVVGAALLLSILLGTDVFIDVALVVLLLGFLGTVSLAIYLERGRVE